MSHLNSALVAVSKDPNPTRFQKTLGVNDFYYGADDFDFPLGHIQMLGKSDREVIRAGSPVPVPASRTSRSTTSRTTRSTSGSPPRTCRTPENRVTVDRNGRIHVAYTDRNTEGHKRLIAKLKGMLGSLGCHPTLIPNQLIRDARIPLAGVAHQCGTVRFGDDPATSALDVDCKAHDLDNLYVVDTSFFPSSSAVNPALTAMANALRVGDHLTERLGARSARAAGGDGVMKLDDARQRDRQGRARGRRRHGGDDGLQHAGGEAARPRVLDRARQGRREGARHRDVRRRRRVLALLEPRPLGLRHRLGRRARRHARGSA